MPDRKAESNRKVNFILILGWSNDQPYLFSNSIDILANLCYNDNYKVNHTQMLRYQA